MPSALMGTLRRHSVRRAVAVPGQVVVEEDFALLGERLLDVSPDGLLVACDRETRCGEPLVLTFRAPQGGPFIDAEGEVARVIEGYRRDDPGYCAGVRFTYMERSTRNELLVRLAGLPPPVPRHREIQESGPAIPSVVVQPVLNLGIIPIPLTRLRAPLGVFRSGSAI